MTWRDDRLACGYIEKFPWYCDSAIYPRLINTGNRSISNSCSDSTMCLGYPGTPNVIKTVIIWPVRDWWESCWFGRKLSTYKTLICWGKDRLGCFVERDVLCWSLIVRLILALHHIYIHRHWHSYQYLLCNIYISIEIINFAKNLRRHRGFAENGIMKIW